MAAVAKVQPPQSSEPPKAPALRKFQWDKPIEQTGVWVLAPMLASGNTSLVVGGSVANNMHVSGIISKIWLLPSGCFLVIVGNKSSGTQRGIMVTGGGCTSELAADYDLSEFL